MQLRAKIIHVGEQRSGFSQASQKNWYAQDVAIEWEEQTVNNRYKQQVLATAWDALDQERMQQAIMNCELIDVKLDFGTIREYQGRKYNDIRLYLPNDFKRKQQ